MALESWLVTFLRAGIPNSNHIIVLTIQQEKPLKGESDFFLTLKAPAACPLSSQPMRLGRNRSNPCSKT